MRIRLLTAAALLGTAAPIAGQENQVEPPKTGSVAGVVIDEKSGDRVAKAGIILRRDEQRTVPSGNVSGGRNLYSTGALFPRTCTEVPGEEGGSGEITRADGKVTLRAVDPGPYLRAE